MGVKALFYILFASFFLFSCGQEGGNSENTTQKEPGVGHTIQIYALGDSLTAGYGVEFTQAYPALLEDRLLAERYTYKVINAGVSGNTSSELLARLDWTLSDARPGDIVILVIGGNDGLRGLSLDDLKKNILSIVSTLQEKELTVVLGGMQIPPNLGLSYARDFKNIYSEIAAEVPKLYFLEFFLEDVAAQRKYNLPDMIHPNPEGYKIIVENLFKFLVDNKIVG